ncbi:MAG TPA: acyltransferase [Steroidobacteraceae bacterium]|jgi:peptidoglycan/LPS O-acetylase OafA/YrhL|nr:acyltransferase [Steroidobacteraceae bacterium]
MGGGPKANNFDLIRLVAALQVAVAHSAGHLSVTRNAGALFTFLALFPGVPIFFFISGFLISRAFENNSVPREYALNRILRIYPALVCCFVVSVGMVWMSGYFGSVHPPLSSLLTWALAQLSMGQFYNPGFLRNYGVGVLNGSTWTISVELQFYVLVPLLYGLLALDHGPRTGSNRRLLALAGLFLLANQAYVWAGAQHAGELWYKLTGVTFVPWFYMFLTGVLAQRNFQFVHKWLAGRLAPAVIVYCAVAWPWSVYVRTFGNDLSPLFFAGLALIAFAAAFSRPGLSDWLLRRNDISYGVYLYHMPVVNLLLVLGFGGTLTGFALAMGATLLLALLSWIAVEKPALRLKRHALYKHNVANISASHAPG